MLGLESKALAGAWSEARVVTDQDADDEHATARKVAKAAAVAEAVTYVAFPIVYFRFRSPVLAAAITCASAAATVTQAEATRRFDRPAAAALAPQLAWLALATPVALYQAAKNRDPLLKTPAVVA
jgi:tryptophan-rich sensory protein